MRSDGRGHSHADSVGSVRSSAGDDDARHRRRAKAVNFGIVYGISPFGLAAATGHRPAEARQYIETYFEKYAGVRAYIDRMLEETRRERKVRTMFGRVRPIPDINSNANSIARICGADGSEYASAGDGCRSDQAGDDPNRCGIANES